jgi:hypothetical protein
MAYVCMYRIPLEVGLIDDVMHKNVLHVIIGSAWENIMPTCFVSCFVRVDIQIFDLLQSDVLFC